MKTEVIVIDTIGWVFLPKEVREQLGWELRSKIEFTVENKSLILTLV